MTTTIQWQKWGRGMMAALLMGLMLSGCIGGCVNIPPITIPVTLLNDAVIPGLPVNGLPINSEFNLPQLCDFPSMTEIEQAVQNSALGFLAERVKIDSVTITEIAYNASVGSFASFQSITMSLVIGQQVVLIGSGAPSSDGTSLVLTSQNPPNLYALLTDVPEGACVNGRIAVVGDAPTENITFDMTMKIRIEASLK